MTLHTDLGDLKLELHCEQCPRACEVSRCNSAALSAMMAANSKHHGRQIRFSAGVTLPETNHCVVRTDLLNVDLIYYGSG